MERVVTMTVQKFDDNTHVCSTGSELIHVDCASHVYPDGSVGIHHMCFRVLEHEIVGLCGANGSGKSTLIEHLNGLLEPSAGKVTFRGANLNAGKRKDIWRNVGLVFQRSDDQLFAPTVVDDVMFGPVNSGRSKEEARLLAEESLKIVGAETLAAKIPSYLSGGQKRLVSIAGVLAMKPVVIAMDEPTSDLDPLHTAIVEDIIRSLRDVHGISVVIATHDLDLAARLCDRICVVKDGSIVAEGQPREVFYDDTVLADAGLKKPTVVDLYLTICRQAGIKPDRTPVTQEELLAEVGRIMAVPALR